MRTSNEVAAEGEKLPATERREAKQPHSPAQQERIGGNTETSTFLPVAWALCQVFDSRGIRYGVFQDLADLKQALAGHDDLDILLDKADYSSFCSVMSEFHAVRGASLPTYDNVCAGREDWFVPDFSRGGYLHLDVHVGIRVGWEFRKRYPLFDHTWPQQWERMEVADGLTISIASAEDETKMALARFAFRVHAAPWTRWVAARGKWSRQFAHLASLPESADIRIVKYAFGPDTAVACRFRFNSSRLEFHRGDLARLKRTIRTQSGFTRRWTVGDPAVHFARKTAYHALRLLGRFLPERVPPKRRPVNGGVVVALIAPDGLGKSTQVERLTTAFGWKFGCRSVYVGTGVGKGWWFRKGVQYVLPSRRKKLKAMAEDDLGGDVSTFRRWKKKLTAVGLACWGILIALERRAAVRRAHRLATRGFIVICDRWPQGLRRGYLDGPVIPANAIAFPGLATLDRLEQRLYREMDELHPDVTLHLVADFATSAKRKPGEISKEGFNARLSLMETLRKRDQGIHVIDASGDVETVNRELFQHVWLSL